MLHMFFSSKTVAAVLPLAVLLVVCSLATVASDKRFTATNVGQGPYRYEEFAQGNPSNHLYNAEDPSIGSFTQSDDAQSADSVYNRGPVQRADEKEYQRLLQSSDFHKSGYSLIERLGTDEQFQKMITILGDQIRRTGREASDSNKIIEGVVMKCYTRPDSWCRDVASVLVDMVYDDEKDGIRMNAASRHRVKRSELESRGYSNVDRFINLHDRFLRDDFSHMTPAEREAHQGISQNQQLITQYVFKELQNLLYKSRYELQDKSKEVQIFNPSQKTTSSTPVLKPVTIANISEETPHLQEDEYFPYNLYTDKRQNESFDTEQKSKEQNEETTSVQKLANTSKDTNDLQEDEYFPSNLYTDNQPPVSFSTDYQFSPTVVYNYNEPIATEQDWKEDLEDISDLSDANTKYYVKWSSTTEESPTTESPFLTDKDASNMRPSQASPTRTTPSVTIPMKTSSTLTQVTETIPTQRTATQGMPTDTSSTYTNPNQTTPLEIPSSTLSRRTVRLPASTRPDYEYASRATPTFAKTTLSPASVAVRSTPRDVLFRTSVPFTPVPPAQYGDTSQALIHDYHDYVLDYESHIIDPSDPNAVLESLLSQQQFKDLSLDSKYYEYYDDGNDPITVDPNKFGVSYQPMTVKGSPDSLNSEYDDSNYPLYEYFIISEYPEGGFVSNVNDQSSLVNSPDVIFQQADNGDEPRSRTVVPIHHLLESVTKTTTAPLSPTTSDKNTIKYEILQNENVHGNVQQVPQYMPSTKFTPDRSTATPHSISQAHRPRKPPVEHSFTIPAQIQNPYIYRTTPQLVTKNPINDQNQKVPFLHHQYSEPLFNKELMLQMEVPVENNTPLYVTTQKVTESPLDNHLFSSVNTLFQQLMTTPAVARTTESPASINTAQLLITLQKNLETLSKLQQNQQKAKETLNRPSVTVAPLNIDNYPHTYTLVDPSKPTTLQNSADLSDNEEMKKSSLEEKRDKTHPRPSLMDILKASIKEDADGSKHQADVLKTITEDNESASPKTKVPSVTSLFFSIPSTSSNNFVNFQQLSPVTISTINIPVVNNSTGISSETPTEVSTTIEPTIAGVVPVILDRSESPSVNTSKTTTAAPPKDENMVFGIPLSIIESEFRLTSADRQKYTSGQSLEKSSTPFGIEKHVTVVNEAGGESTELVKPDEITAKDGDSQENNSLSSVAAGRISDSLLESELRTASSEESVNLLDMESQRIRDENTMIQKLFSNRLSQTHTHHEMGSVPKSQIGFFPQLMATLLAPFRTTTEASRKSTVSIKGTSQSNLQFTSRAYTQSNAGSTLQALFNPSTEHPQKEKSKQNEYFLNDHSKQGSFGKHDVETTKNTYVTETIPVVSTNAYDTTIMMVGKESSLSTRTSTSIEDSDQSFPEDAGLPMTTSDFMASQTVDYPWLYEDLPSIDGDSMFPEQMATEFSDQPSNSFESTTQELTSPTGTDPTIWSDEKQFLLNLQKETTPALEDLDEGSSITVAPTSSSLIVTDTELLTYNVEASSTEPSRAVQYEQGLELEGYSISESESTLSNDLRTDEFSELYEQTTVPSQMTSPEQTTNTLDDSSMETELGNSTETYKLGVTLQHLLQTAKTLMGQSTSPSYQSYTESDIVSAIEKSTEQPQLEATLTALFLTNSIEKDYVYVTTAAMPGNTFDKVTSDHDESTTHPSHFSDNTSTTDVASSTSSSDVTEIAQVLSSSSPDITSSVAATAISTTNQSSTLSYNTNSTTFEIISTTPTAKGSTMSGGITTPISGTIKRVPTSPAKLATTEPNVGTTSRPASSLQPQLNSFGGHFVNASSLETRPPSILWSLNGFRRTSSNGFVHTAETLALSRSLCSAASSTDMPRTPSMRYILQKCAMLKLSGLL